MDLLAMPSPAIARTAAPLVAAAWGRPVGVWVMHGFGACTFDLPAPAEVLAPAPPRYRLRADFRWTFGVAGPGGLELADRADPGPLREGTPVYAGGRNHTEALAFATSLDLVLGDGAGAVERPAVVLDDLSAEGVSAAAQAGARFPGMLGGLLGHGRTKHHVDANFAVGSRDVLGPALAAVGIDPLRHRLSKYGLQALYHIADGSGRSEDDLIARFADWARAPDGTVLSLGSPSSYAGILGQLVSAGLVGIRGGRHRLTPAGGRFLELLHPDCLDPRLPERIHAWCSAGLEVSRPAIDAYLVRFFGRQQRHLAARLGT